MPLTTVCHNDRQAPTNYRMYVQKNNKGFEVTNCCHYWDLGL